MKARKHLDIRLPHLRIPLWWPDLPDDLRAWLPSRGNVLFTLLVVAGLLWASSAGALPLRTPAAAGTSTGAIAYQGRLADSAGNPITDTVNMEFRLYDVADGGAPLWTELWTGANAVRVSDGLFNVMLGSLTPISQGVIAGRNQLWLGITVGTDDEMTPRVQLGSVPFAVQALTVPDGSITQDKAPSLIRATNGNSRKIQYGHGTISATTCEGTGYYCADITLPEPFQDANYSVVVTPQQRSDLKVVSKTANGFRVRSDFQGYHEFDWVAVGR